MTTSDSPTVDVQTPNRRKHVKRVLKYSVGVSIGMFVFAAVLGGGPGGPEVLILFMLLSPVLFAYLYVRLLEGYVDDLDITVRQ